MFSPQELPGGAAMGVGQDFGSLEHISLLLVVRRHGDVALGEPGRQLCEELRIAGELQGECSSNRLAGEIVFGWAEAAREDDDVGAKERDTHRGGEVLKVVSDDRFERNGDAEIV